MSSGQKGAHASACMCSKACMWYCLGSKPGMCNHICSCMCSKTCMCARMCSQTRMGALVHSYGRSCALVCAPKLVYGRNQSGCEKAKKKSVIFTLYTLGFLDHLHFFAWMKITMGFKHLEASHIMSGDSWY